MKITWLKMLSLVENKIISLKITLCMLVAICRSHLYRPHVKVYRPLPLKWPCQENEMCENAADQHFYKCEISFKQLK